MGNHSPSLAGLQNDNHLDLDVSEISLRSTLDELIHLLIPPSRLTIMDSSEVGSGKYGEVLLATLDGSSQTPTLVAVKELRTVGTRGVRKRVALRLARELKIWAKVNHPHILQLVGYYLSDDYETARLISPFMTNGNVSQYLEKLRVGVLKRMDIIQGIALGMDHLHSCSPPICHGDLKPANILMNDSLQAVLCDFGLASFVEESDISTGLTTSRSIKGSIRYMSPELLLEEDAKHTLESDIWAWGCTAFEIVTDCAPYNAVKGDRGIIMAFMREDPPGSTEILNSRLVDETSADGPPAFLGLPDCLTKCWAFEKTQRPRMPNILRSVFQDTRIEETSRPPETAIETLKDLINHQDLNAQLPQLDRRTNEQPVDVTIRGATRQDHVVSLAQQHAVPPPDRMSRFPWSIMNPSSGGRTLFGPYLDLPSTRSRQLGKVDLTTVESPSASASQSIFGAPLQQIVAIANIALRVRDARGELKTWGYIPVIVAKCGAALKDYSDHDQNATMRNFHQYVAPKEDSVRQLRQRYSKPPKYGKYEKWDKYRSAKVPALATALLMNYLGGLPIALVPQGRFAEFAKIHEDSKQGDSPQTTTTRYFELLCDLPPSNMYLLMYLAETLDYIGRHARVEITDLATTFANCVFRPQRPSRPLETAIEILKDLISHRDLDAQLLRLNRRADEQSVDVAVHGATRLDYVVSLAQQHGVPGPDIEIHEAESIDDNPTTDIEVESTPVPTGKTVRPADQSSLLAPDSGPSSLEGVPDLSEYIKKDKDAGKKWGGFCEVYVGYYKNLETGEELPVALRLPNMRQALDATQRRFIREVKLWFGLKHQNINPLLGTFVDEQGIHMVSPWRRRGDVYSLLKNKNLTSVDLRKILLGVSSALCYLHTAGYVHGDLKMENVLLADDGEPFLTDFGLSKGENISVMTSTGNGACSYPWSAPEILMGDPKSKSSDVYAFGMMIIETLTWNQPFAAYKVAGALMLAIMDGKRPERKEVIHERAPRYWESLWELAENCWPQAATARPTILHVHGNLTRAMA